MNALSLIGLNCFWVHCSHFFLNLCVSKLSIIYIFHVFYIQYLYLFIIFPLSILFLHFRIFSGLFSVLHILGLIPPSFISPSLSFRLNPEFIPGLIPEFIPAYPRPIHQTFPSSAPSPFSFFVIFCGN